jgi:hypothetical protein
MGFKAKRKQESDFISESNRKKRLAWAKQHRVLAKDDWRKWIFSDKGGHTDTRNCCTITRTGSGLVDDRV